MIKRIFDKFKQERDLTSGSISKNLWILAIPMLSSNLMQAAFNLVDMIWVGKLGPVALAAVAMSGSIMMILMFFMMGIGMGTTALVARAIGAKDREKADNTAMQSLIMGFAGSIILAVIGYFLSPWLLGVLGAQPEVVQSGTGYLQIIFLGTMVIFYMFLISAILQGAGDAVTPMIILAVATLINIVLDPLLIFGIGIFPKLGVNGAAWASVFAEAVGSLMALDVLLKGKSRIHVRMRYLKIDLDTMWKIIKIGVPVSLQMSLRGLVGIVLMSVVAGFGTYAIAAYGVGLRLNMLALMPGFALGVASGTLVGQNLGAKQPGRAAASVWAAILYYGIFMSVLGFIFILFAPRIIGFFNNDPEVIRIGADFFRITSWGYLFVALGVILNRSLSGAADTIAPMIITFVALWLVQIPLAVFLSRIPALGLNGIWFAVLAAYFAQGILAALWFQTGRWKTKKV